jgi:hypothetical protein
MLLPLPPSQEAVAALPGGFKALSVAVARVRMHQSCTRGCLVQQPRMLELPGRKRKGTRWE